MSSGSVDHLEVGARVRWVSEETGLTRFGTILPDPQTDRSYPVDREGFECPELRWIAWDDDTAGPDLVGVLEEIAEGRRHG